MSTSNSKRNWTQFSVNKIKLIMTIEKKAFVIKY